MHVAILTFEGFNEPLLIAWGILNRIKKPDCR